MEFSTPAPGLNQLRLRPMQERLRDLLDDKELLLRKIAHKRAVERTLVDQARAAVERFVTATAPVMAEVSGLHEEIHALFAALLADARRHKKEKKQIRQVFQMLQASGAVPKAEQAPRVDGESGSPFPEDEHMANDAAPGTAERPADRTSLRLLFRRLAEGLHPDKVQDEPDRARRTEMMKEVTAAYHDGDLARLLEVQRAFEAEEDLELDGQEDRDGIERRCAALVAELRELRAQFKKLEKGIRDLRRGPEFELLRQMKRAGSTGQIVSEAQEERDEIRAIRDHVRDFSEGKMSLEEFVAGPDSDEELDDGVDPFEDLLALLVAAEFGPPPGATRAAGKKKRRARKR